MGISDLLSEIQSQGYDLKNILTDGKIHRFKTNLKPNKKNGWYVAHEYKLASGETLSIVTVGDWSTGEKNVFNSKKNPSAQEALYIDSQIAKQKNLAERAKKKANDRAARVAERIIGRGKKVESHGYLTRKQILPNGSGIVQYGDNILIPIVNEMGEVRSFQSINSNSEKRFLAGSEVRGNFNIIAAKGPKEKRGIICEGYSTAMSVYEAFGEKVDVVIAFNADNMPVVAKKMIKVYGLDNLWCACDDDRFSKKNVGREAGNKCEALGLKVFYPNTTPRYDQAKGTDFNDLMVSDSLDEVRRSFVRAAEPAPQIDADFQMVGFYKVKKTVTDSGKVKITEQPQYLMMAEQVFENKNMCFDDSESLKFDNKKWSWLTKTAFQNFIYSANKECIKPFHLDNFAKMIKAKCHTEALGITQPDAMINVGNGVIDVKSGALLPHSYKYMFKYCAEVNYESSATCEKWKTFLKEVFENNDDLINLSQRLFGYIIIGGKPFLHRAFVLFGSGRNGKSTFLDVLRAVIGHESYSVVSMAKLDKEFSIVNIDGKLANIVEETPSDEINAEIFKTLVGGGEVQAAHKGFDEYTFRCNARFVFACNEMPIFKDKSVGLEDRLVFIPFNRYFKESERDTEITEKLLLELPGILNWAVDGAKLIMKERKLESYKVTTDAKEEYRKETDPLYAWFCEEITLSNAAAKLTVKEIFDRYKIDCEHNGNRPYSKDKFSKRFRKLISDKSAELGIEYDPDLRDPMGSTRVYGCVAFTRILTGLTGDHNKLSDKKWNGYT